METKKLYFDFETVPNLERAMALGLYPESLPEYPLFLEDYTFKTDAEAKSILGKYYLVLNQDDFDGLVEKEEFGKNRVTVLNTIKAMGAAKAKLFKTLATMPETARIIALGWALDNEEPTSIVVDGFNETEHTIIKKFGEIAESAEAFIGFGILHFDLPLYFVRAAMLQFPSNRLIDISRYRPEGIFDLQRVRFPAGAKQGWGMKQLAKAYNIPIPCEDVDGSTVYDCYEDDQIDKIGDYVESDVSVIREIAKFYGGYFMPPVHLLGQSRPMDSSY